MYPFSSFVAEAGGALGLFLGFSFLMLWNVLEASKETKEGRHLGGVIKKPS